MSNGQTEGDLLYPAQSSSPFASAIGHWSLGFCQFRRIRESPSRIMLVSTVEAHATAAGCLTDTPAVLAADRIQSRRVLPHFPAATVSRVSSRIRGQLIPVKWNS